MIWLMETVVLVAMQTIAALVVLALGHGWLLLDPAVVSEVFPAVVIGLVAIGASLLLPLALLKRGRNG
jgi:hypothetical protein